MADQEVIKHTKKVYKIWNSKEHSLWHKIKEFFIEIMIIVFAVSFSIWLHDASEHNHQQKEVKEFLTGLREDLKSDLSEIQNDKRSYEKQTRIFKYISHTKINEPLNADTIREYQTWISNSTGLQQHNGRFEGFKTSGKIGTIEDKKLQNDIMDLYQEYIPSVILSTNVYLNIKSKLFDYLASHKKKLTDSTSNIALVLKEDEAQNICEPLAYTDEIMERYDSCAGKMQMIINEIKDKYNIDGR